MLAITIKMLNGLMATKVTERLEVSNTTDYGQKLERWLRLPTLYTRKGILVNTNGIIKPDQLS